jgi:hypothetical protein
MQEVQQMRFVLLFFRLGVLIMVWTYVKRARVVAIVREA